MLADVANAWSFDDLHAERRGRGGSGSSGAGSAGIPMAVESLTRRGGSEYSKQGATAHRSLTGDVVSVGVSGRVRLPAAVDEAERGMEHPAIRITGRFVWVRTRIELPASTAVQTPCSRGSGGGNERCRGGLGLAVASAGAMVLAGVLLLTAAGLGSKLAAGMGSLVVVASALGRRTRSSARSHPFGRRAGGFATPCPGKAGEPSTLWRSPPPGSPLWSRRRRGPTRGVTLPLCTTRRCGSRDAGEGGHGAASSASYASYVHGASNASSTTFWWCRSTA